MSAIHDKEYILKIERRITSVLDTAWKRLTGDRALITSFAQFVAEDCFLIEEYIGWQKALEERTAFINAHRVVGEAYRVLLPAAMLGILGFPAGILLALQKRFDAAALYLCLAAGLLLAALIARSRGTRYRLVRREIAAFRKDPRYVWLRDRFGAMKNSDQSVAWRNRRLTDLQFALFGDALTERRQTLMWMFVS